MAHRSKLEQERILLERAELLAQVTSQNIQEGDHLEVTIFSIGAERYAIESTLVQEIVSINNLMPLPCVPPHIAGIFNLRGKLFAAVDLRTLLGISAESEGNEKKLVVLHDAGMEFGLVADEIEGVLSLPLSRVKDTLVTLQANGAKYLRGVTSDRLVLLDGLQLIHDPNLVVSDENC
jgi:purine-binding chemotaxis protein CheW